MSTRSKLIHKGHYSAALMLGGAFAYYYHPLKRGFDSCWTVSDTSDSLLTMKAFNIVRMYKTNENLALNHVIASQKMLELFKAQGGVYVKAGQHMSSLFYLLPPVYCTTMRELNNRASARPFEEVKPMIEEELGEPIEAM